MEKDSVKLCGHTGDKRNKPVYTVLMNGVYYTACPMEYMVTTVRDQRMSHDKRFRMTCRIMGKRASKILRMVEEHEKLNAAG